MSRHIGKPVPVEAGSNTTPKAFTYKGTVYRVHEVLGRWILVDRWWEPVRAVKGRSNRYYYRVVTADHQVFDLYLDVAWRPPLWVLDIIHD